MEKLISHSVKLLLGGFTYTLYKYQKIKTLEHEIKTIPHLDLDYQPITSNLNQKYCIIFSSISKIVNSKNEELKYKNIYESLETKTNKNFIINKVKIKHLNHINT